MTSLLGARYAKPLFSVCLLGAFTSHVGAVQVTKSSPVYVAPVVEQASMPDTSSVMEESLPVETVSNVSQGQGYTSRNDESVASQASVDDVEDFGIISDDVAPANPLADDRQLLVQELQNLRSQVELQAKQIQELKKSNKSLYEDLDRRLQALAKKVVELKGQSTSDSAQAIDSSLVDKENIEGSLTAGNSSKDSSSNLAEVSDKSVTTLQTETDRSRYLKAKALLDQGGQDTRAAAEFLTILKDHPNTLLKPNIYYWLAQTYKRRGEYDKAERYYNRVLSEYPGSLKAASSLGSLANLKESQGQMDAAKSLWSQLIREYPKSSEAVTAKQRLEL